MHLTRNVKCQTNKKINCIPSKNFKMTGSTYVYLLRNIPEYLAHV